MSGTNLINRFVSSYPSYYSADMVSDCTGIAKDEAIRWLEQLVVGNVIRRISQHEPIYVTNRGPWATKVATIHTGNWVFNLSDCQDIASLLKCTQVKSIREIAKMLKRSRQWTYLYLEAMISVDAIGIDQSGYYTKCFANIFKVGSVVKKGIIGELREQCGIKPNRPKSHKSNQAVKKIKVRKPEPKRWSLRRTEQAAGI